MNRRNFLRSAGVVSASFALPGRSRLLALSSVPGPWRTTSAPAPRAIGGAKMKVHKACVQRLFESNDAILDVDGVYEIAKGIA